MRNDTEAKYKADIIIRFVQHDCGLLVGVSSHPVSLQQALASPPEPRHLAAALQGHSRLVVARRERRPAE